MNPYRNQLIRLAFALGIATTVSVGFRPSAGLADEDIQRIVVVVNDQIVSEYDVSQRLGLIIATTGRLESEEQYQQMRKQVVGTLVDEKLQYLEAREHELNINEQEVEQKFNQLAAGNRITPDQFSSSLIQMGTSKDAIMHQLRAGLAWSNVVDSRMRPFLSIGDAEVNSFLDRLVANKGQPEYMVSEIFLSVDSPGEEDETRTAAVRLVQQIRSGVGFDAVARQFSDLSTAAIGGDLGWMMRDQLNEDVVPVIAKMVEGTTTDPIRAAGGYYIMQLRDKRKVMSGDPDETVLELQQLIMTAPSEGIDAEMARLTEEAKKINSCHDITSAARAMGSHDFGSLGSLRLGDLPPILKAKVEYLKAGNASQPIVMDGEIRVLVVCDLEEPEGREPNFLEIEDFLSNQRLGLIARRYLRDLRRDAIIDYR